MRPIFRLALALLLVCFLFLLAIPPEISASPFKIEGYLKDAGGSPIPRANISLSGKLYDYMTDTYTPTTLYAETDLNGYYVKYVWGWDEPGGFPRGSMITISYAGEEVVSTTVTVDGSGAWGNLTYEESKGLIDILSSPTVLILIIVVVISTIMMGYYIIHSGKTEAPKEEGSKRVERRRRGK